MPIVRVMRLVTRKKRKFIPQAPATIHKMSSGNSGKSIITKKAHLPRSRSLQNSSPLSLPTIQYISLLPNTLPKIYATILPRSIASKLMPKAIHGPKQITPTMVLTEAGIGIMLTCKNCITANTA